MEEKWNLVKKKTNQNKTIKSNVRLKRRDGEFSQPMNIEIISNNKQNEIKHEKEQITTTINEEKNLKKKNNEGKRTQINEISNNSNNNIGNKIKKNKPTKTIGLMDLIEAQLKGPKQSQKQQQKQQQYHHHHHQQQQQQQQQSNRIQQNGKNTSIIHKVKVLESNENGQKEFIIIKKAPKKKLSTIKKRILLVTNILFD